jgi:hypothetical protein
MAPIQAVTGGLCTVRRSQARATWPRCLPDARIPNLPRGERTLERWFDTSVFARPAPGQVGNGRKDVVRLPGVRDTGLTISKMFPFSGGRRTAQFRWEVYNLFNSVQYNAIDRAARFDAQGRQVNARFGQMTSTRGPRVMQGSIRFNF